MDLTRNSQKTPHSLPRWASYEVSIVSILEKNSCVILGVHCTRDGDLSHKHKQNLTWHPVPPTHQLTFHDWVTYRFYGGLSIWKISKTYKLCSHFLLLFCSGSINSSQWSHKIYQPIFLFSYCFDDTGTIIWLPQMPVKQPWRIWVKQTSIKYPWGWTNTAV